MRRETILYVDDEEMNLELFKVHFEDEYEVILASSGLEGLEILKTRKDINLIISDVKMPKMNGFQFIRKVKAFAPDKICIILSAYREADFTDLNNAKKDIYSYLNKPWRRSEINNVILKAIDNYKSLQEA